MGMAKYQNKKTMADERLFDSKKEALRYLYLRQLEREGTIRGLECQKTFELIPSQRDSITKRVLERACCYKADFCYIGPTGKMVVEDVKSPATKTPEYIIKRKLMLWIHKIRVREV